MYQMLHGETISIRYDPERQDRYYCRAHWLSWAGLIAKAVLVLVLAGGFLTWRIWMIVEKRSL